ncbi:MAG: TonB family protein [Kofleriaceae bacterium]
MERGFIGLDIAVLAVSEVATIADDVPARVVIEKLESAGHRVVARDRIDDSLQLIRAKYLEWIADAQVEVVVVIASAKSEAASDALAPLVTKPLAGFAELFRSITFADIGTSAMLVDAAAGQCKSTFVFVLPASIGAVRTALDRLLLPQLDYRTKPLNIVMRMPRHHQGTATAHDAAAPKTPWIVPKDPSAPVVAPPKVAKRAGTEPGTPAALATAASVSHRIAVAAIARPEPVSVSQRMSAALEAAAVPNAFIEEERTDVGVPPPPVRTKVTTAKDNLPLKRPAQIPLSQLLSNQLGADAVEELPASELKEIAPAQIVDDEQPVEKPVEFDATSVDFDAPAPPPPPREEVPIPAGLSTKIPTGPIRIEDEGTREAIIAAQKRAVTERVTPIDHPIDDLPPRSVAIPARRKRDKKLLAIWAIIVVAAASIVVMFFLARERDRRAQAMRDAQRDADSRVAGLTVPPAQEPIATPEPAIPDAGAEPTEPTEPPEIDMSTDPSVVEPPPARPDPRIAITPTRPPTTPQPRRPKEPKPVVEKPVVETPEPDAPPVEAGCDEVSCVLDRYKLSCCAKYKPAETATPPVRSGLPEKLEKSMVTQGISKVKPAVIACGEKSGVQGQVRISVTVSPAGTVTDASVAASPDEALGACVAGAVRKATFATTETGGSFTYPFVF